MDTASCDYDIALVAAAEGILPLLKSMGEEVDLRGAKDPKGDTTLHFAASKGCLDCCRFLVEESGLDVDSLSKTGVTPMFYAALRGNVHVMRYLLDRGGDPALRDERGSTPLHSAAEEGHCEAARLLLNAGVPVDPVDYRGTPLHLAATRDHAEVLKLLLEHGADVTCPFHSLLVGLVATNKMASHYLSPLMLACCGRSLKCIKLLIEAGADVNAHGFSGPTPLTKAVEDGLTEIVKLLLEAEADPNIPNQLGAIPVAQAAALGRRELVECLFPRTKPIPSLPDWTVDGIIRSVNSVCMNPPEAIVSEEERSAALKSRGNEALAKEEYMTAICFYGMVTDADPFDADMYAKQSLCWLRLRDGAQALFDARRCRMLRAECCGLGGLWAGIVKAQHSV